MAAATICSSSRFIFFKAFPGDVTTLGGHVGKPTLWPCTDDLVQSWLIQQQTTGFITDPFVST